MVLTTPNQLGIQRHTWNSVTQKCLHFFCIQHCPKFFLHLFYNQLNSCGIIGRRHPARHHCRLKLLHTDYNLIVDLLESLAPFNREIFTQSKIQRQIELSLAEGLKDRLLGSLGM